MYEANASQESPLNSAIMYFPSHERIHVLFNLYCKLLHCFPVGTKIIRKSSEPFIYQRVHTSPNTSLVEWKEGPTKWDDISVDKITMNNYTILLHIYESQTKVLGFHRHPWTWNCGLLLNASEVLFMPPRHSPQRFELKKVLWCGWELNLLCHPYWKSKTQALSSLHNSARLDIAAQTLQLPYSEQKHMKHTPGAWHGLCCLLPSYHSFAQRYGSTATSF